MPSSASLLASRVEWLSERERKKHLKLQGKLTFLVSSRSLRPSYFFLLLRGVQMKWPLSWHFSSDFVIVIGGCPNFHQWTVADVSVPRREVKSAVLTHFQSSCCHLVSFKSWHNTKPVLSLPPRRGWNYFLVVCCLSSLPSSFLFIRLESSLQLVLQHQQAPTRSSSSTSNALLINCPRPNLNACHAAVPSKSKFYEIRIPG